jgi:5-methylcytosine-specific restriction endonuclease McrA
MNYDILKAQVDRGCSTHELARVLKTSQTNIRYWLRRFELRTDRTKFAGVFRCKCGETDPKNYYGNKRTMCAKCDNAYTLNRQRKMTERIRAFFGNKCLVCGFKKYQIALALHHLNPSTKDPTFQCLRGWSWERVLIEIKKCVLLCHNCHAAVHHGLIVVNVTF